MEYKEHIWVAIISFLAGILCILLNKIAPATIVIIIGVAFVASGVMNALLQFKKAKNNYKPSVMTLVTSLAAAILGSWLIIAPEDNISFITRLVAILIILSSAYHVINMLVNYKTITFPTWFYIFPILIFAVGLWMLIAPLSFASFIFLAAGIVMILFGIATGLEVAVIATYTKKMPKQSPSNQSIDINYIDEK